MKIYTLTNRLTGMVYVGATTISMSRRLGVHRQDAEKGKTTLIAQAIREHGWENFDVAVIATANSLDELLTMEAEIMRRLNTLTPNGYNRSSYGSHGWNFTAEERATISKATKGRQPWNMGLSTGPMPEATKEKQRLAHLGQIPGNKGTKHSLEARLRMRKVAAERGWHPRQRAVEVNGISYHSLAEAVQLTGLTRMQVRYKLRQGRAHYLEPAHEKGS